MTKRLDRKQTQFLNDGSTVESLHHFSNGAKIPPARWSPTSPFCHWHLPFWMLLVCVNVLVVEVLQIETSKTLLCQKGEWGLPRVVWDLWDSLMGDEWGELVSALNRLKSHLKNVFDEKKHTGFAETNLQSRDKSSGASCLINHLPWGGKWNELLIQTAVAMRQGPFGWWVLPLLFPDLLDRWAHHHAHHQGHLDEYHHLQPPSKNPGYWIVSTKWKSIILIYMV